MDVKLKYKHYRTGQVVYITVGSPYHFTKFGSMFFLHRDPYEFCYGGKRKKFWKVSEWTSGAAIMPSFKGTMKDAVKAAKALLKAAGADNFRQSLDKVNMETQEATTKDNVWKATRIQIERLKRPR